MRRLIIFLTIIQALTINLIGQKTERLEDDRTIRKVFTSYEIDKLDLIISYFDNVIMNWASTPDTNKAYHEFLNSIIKSEDYENIYKRVNPIPQKRKDLFDTLIVNNFFNEIWYYDTVMRIRTRDTFLLNPPDFYSLELNIKGKYVKYLKKLGRRDKLYKGVYSDIMACAAIPPTTAWGSIQNNHLIDFNKEYNRLFMAINLLTFEENTETRVKKYLEKKGSTHNNIYIKLPKQ